MLIQMATLALASCRTLSITTRDLRLLPADLDPVVWCTAKLSHIRVSAAGFPACVSDATTFEVDT